MASFLVTLIPAFTSFWISSSLIGAPQFGQLLALSLTYFPHSLHLISAIIYKHLLYY